MKFFKKLVLLLIIAAMFLTACTSETPPNGPNDPDEPNGPGPEEVLNLENFEIDEVGRLIPVTAVTSATGSAPAGSGTILRAVNNTGMSGSDSTVHTRRNGSATMMRVTGAPAADSGLILTVGRDIGNDANTIIHGPFEGRPEALGKLYVWNYNAPADASNRGMRNITISLSLDGDAWTEFGSFELARADGSDRYTATNLVGGGVIDFHGAVAKYIRIVPNDADGNWGGEGYGLGTLRLFRFKPMTHINGELHMTPIMWRLGADRTRWAFGFTEEEFNMTSGLGLTMAGDCFTHSNNPDHMFARTLGTTVAGSELRYDLGGTFPVQRLKLWNYNDPANLDWGLNEFTLFTSVSQETSGPGAWAAHQVGGQNVVFTLPRGTGAADMGVSLVIDLPEPIHARYIALRPRTLDVANHGSDRGTRMGISAIRAYAGAGWAADYHEAWTGLMSFYGDTGQTDNNWSGADGIYSFNLDGIDWLDNHGDLSELRTHFTYSDSFFAPIVDPVTRRAPGGRSMPNSTFWSLYGGLPVEANRVMHPVNHGNRGMIQPRQFLQPPFAQSQTQYYWLGDGVVIGDSLFIFSLRIQNFGALGFEQIDVDLAEFTITDGVVDYTDYVLHHNVMDPDTWAGPWSGLRTDIDGTPRTYHFGGAVFANTAEHGAVNPDGWIYVFGYSDPNRHVIASRVRPENFANQNMYEFYYGGTENGNPTWGPDPRRAARQAIRISPEFSVHRVPTGPNAGKYMMTYQYNTISRHLHFRLADNPWGPWGPTTRFFSLDTVNTVFSTANLSTYNTKAHPAISWKGELLISYNINGGMPAFIRGDIYRPRFLKMRDIPSRTALENAGFEIIRNCPMLSNI